MCVITKRLNTYLQTELGCLESYTEEDGNNKVDSAKRKRKELYYKFKRQTGSSNDDDPASVFDLEAAEHMLHRAMSGHTTRSRLTIPIGDREVVWRAAPCGHLTSQTKRLPDPHHHQGQ